MASDSGRFEGAAAGTLVGIFIVVLVVVLVLAFWVAWRIFNCIVRAFLTRPTCLALWLTAAGVAVSLALARLTGGMAMFYVSTAISFLALLISAQAVLLSSDPLYQPEPSREQFVDEIRHWFPRVA
jgi:Ca2+/Na+ antiporter